MESMQTHHNLDFMRTLAVCLVFIDHATLFANIRMFHGWDLRWLGVFGVYLFFVHTCLVLMWSLERRPHTLDFYVRRVFRIYPLAIFTVLLVIGLRLKIYDSSALSLGTVFSNLLLAQNLWVHENIIGVLWSLPLELQMYLVLPVLFLFARRERTIWPFLVFWLFTCAAAIALYGSHGGNGLYGVIPHFLPGVIAYLGFKRWPARLPAASFPLLLLGLLCFFQYAPSPRQGWIICLALGLALPFFRDFRNKILIRVSHTVATYSYGIYLLHIVCLYLGFFVLKGHSFWIRMGVTLSTLALSSWAAYHFIEQPMVKIGSRAANRLQVKFGTDYKSDYGLDLA